jgi:DnaA-homolog protein
MRQLVLQLTAPPAPTLDSFVPGRNEELIAVLREMATGTSTEHFLYLWGSEGCGKSHLIAAASAALVSTRRPVFLVTGEQDLLRLPADISGTALAVDDVHRLSDRGAAALFNRYNAQRENGGVLLATGDAPPTRLRLRADLVTRLGWGLVYQVHSLSDENKATALAEHARKRAFPLAEDVIDYVLTRQQRDLPYLMALIDALDRYSLETKRAVTVPLVRELLAQTGDSH